MPFWNDNTTLLNSIVLQQTSSIDSYYKFINITGSVDNLYFNKDSKYKISYKIYSDSDNPIILFITSSKSSSFNDDSNFGKFIDDITIKKYTITPKEHIIVAEKNGSGSLCFVAKYGTHYISDIEVAPFYSKNISPDETKIIVPSPFNKRGEDISIVSKFIGNDGKVAGDTNELTNAGLTNSPSTYSTITGSNLVISYDDNLIEGALFVGSSLKTGVEISGYNSALIRSIGYHGFNSASKGTGSGFFMYSGSVLPGSGDSYSGVGLELVGNSSSYFRYRKDKYNDFIEIFTDKFFLGGPYQFISGSGGQIQISSSNFMVSGNTAIINGTIYASAGRIGGFTITTSSLTSANIFISGSPLPGGINDTKYMFISTSNFNVKQNGDITGSNVLFTGGKISSFYFTPTEFSTEIPRGEFKLTPYTTIRNIQIYQTGSGDQRLSLDPDGIKFDAVETFAGVSGVDSYSIINFTPGGPGDPFIDFPDFSFWIYFSGVTEKLEIMYDEYDEIIVSGSGAEFLMTGDSSNIQVTQISSGDLAGYIGSFNFPLTGSAGYSGVYAEITGSIDYSVQPSFAFLNVLSQYADFTGDRLKYFYQQRAAFTYYIFNEQNRNERITFTPGAVGYIQLHGYGIQFGPQGASPTGPFSTDINLYRKSSGILKTDNTFEVGNDLIALQNFKLSGSQVFYNTEDPDVTGGLTTDTFLFQSSSNTTLGKDLYFRQDGNLVKWKWIEGNLSTGLLYGGELTFSESEGQYFIEVGPGSGIVYYSNASLNSEINPQIKYITWDYKSEPAKYITSSMQTYVYIGQDGILYQQPTHPTHDQLAENIYLGAFLHANRTRITSIFGHARTSYSNIHQFHDFVDAFGPIKSTGLGVIAHVTGMGFSISPGDAFVLGGFYQYQPNHPSYYQSSGYETASIARFYRSGSTFISDNNSGTFYIALDPSKYDKNGDGTLEPVGVDQWSIQRAFLNPLNGRVSVYYGQKVYEKQELAIAGFATDPFTESEFTAKRFVHIGSFILKGNSTNLINTNNTIIQAGLFRNAGGGGGGGTAGISKLEDLTNVNISSPTTGQSLVYNAGTWINGTPLSSISSSYLSGSAHVDSLTACGDILPCIDNTYDVGSQALRFAEIWGRKITANELVETSDISLKYNLIPITNAVDKVMQIHGYTFNKKDGQGEHRRAGVIAQEVEKILPEVVTEDINNIKSVNYGNLISLLIEAIKEQQKEIEELKNEVRLLK